MARPNITSVAIRHRFDTYETIGWADPAYGIPQQNCPMIWDTTSLLYRPFSSVVTAADAYGGFAGFSDDYLDPRGDGGLCQVTIVRSGIVEVKLNTPTEVNTETLLTPVASGGAVLNDTFAVSATANQCILKVVRVCGCPSCQKEVCPPAADDPAAQGASATAEATWPTQRTVWAYFNVPYVSLT